MSVQFGRWNIDGLPVDRDYLAKAGEMLAPYGPDGGGAHIKDNVGILYRAFHTTKESRKETQPFVTPSGAVLSWDGRLDNREQILRELREVFPIGASDLAIVAAAYEAWGTKSFAKLIGDWALSLWDSRSRSLVLVKDPIGTRHLYYSFDKERVTWSTILDPLVLLAGKTLNLEEEYIAGWFSSFPATHLTPYVGIHSVPPSCFVRFEHGRQTSTKYWEFDPSKPIRYRTDGEYEEHFRHVFGESVRRRLRSDSPILAELSGGMDSSSIVCIADQILGRGEGETPRLDTLSYYNDSEPNWDEKAYFTKVEEKRGRTGCHIDVGGKDSLRLEFKSDTFAATPASLTSSSEAANQFAAYLSSQGNRVVLSGIGGDEVTGGVPTPVPELMDLIAQASLKRLAHQLKLWALTKRKPWFYLLFEALRGFFPPVLVGVPEQIRPAPWLQKGFIRRNRTVLTSYPSKVTFFGSLPSFQQNFSTLDGLRRQLACSPIPPLGLFEKRYPYLDRSLLEFLFAVPRDQLVRPKQRRSLMRRALVAIVPGELLNRKRKAFVVRTPMLALSAESPAQSIGARLGIIDQRLFWSARERVRRGMEVPIVYLFRTLMIEGWLKSLQLTLSQNIEDSCCLSRCSKRNDSSVSAQITMPLRRQLMRSNSKTWPWKIPPECPFVRLSGTALPQRLILAARSTNPNQDRE